MATSRAYPDWIEACVRATEGSEIPLLFRKWAALTAVAGALGRKCWYDHGTYKVRPNLYVIMIGPPSSGKTTSLTLPHLEVLKRLTVPIGLEGDDRREAQERVEQFLGPGAEPLRLNKDNITPQKLAVDMAMASHFVHDLYLKGYEEVYDATITLITSEFGTLMSRNNTALHMLLTEAWDSGASYEYKTKEHGQFYIKGPCLNWIACATATQFIEHMPANAADQGLLSRIIPVFYDGPPMPIRTRSITYNKEDLDNLLIDLAQISKLMGEFVWEEGLEEEIQAWLDAGQPPCPTDPMMVEYVGRRYSHLRKIAMCISASRRDDMVIRRTDWNTALEMLTEVEGFMPKILRRFGMTDTGRFIDDLLQYIRSKGGRVKSSVIKREAIRIARSISDIEQALTIMVDSGILKQEGPMYEIIGEPVHAKRKKVV